MASAVRGALTDLKLDTGRVGFDDMGFGFRLEVEGLEVADGYDPLMFARAVKTETELCLLQRATALNEAAIRRTIAAWNKGGLPSSRRIVPQWQVVPEGGGAPEWEAATMGGGGRGDVGGAGRGGCNGRHGWDLGHGNGAPRHGNDHDGEVGLRGGGGGGEPSG